MMITKIISAGQTGADQGALDAAIKLKVQYGGWISRGRPTENGPLADSYRLLELVTDDYTEQTVKNVMESDGTLILTHGKLTGSSELPQKLAYQHNKICLHVDLNDKPIFLIASDVYKWVLQNTIKVLYVAGSRASEDPEIYQDTFYVIEGVLLLGLLHSGAGDNLSENDLSEYYNRVMTLPRTVDQAVNILLLALDKETMDIFAGRSETDLNYYHRTAGALIIKQFKLLEGNEELIESCRMFTGQPELDGRGAAVIILEVLWHSLRQTRH
ncbi:MAG: putative molybdenum carrier protein [Thermodesulfobacteriota bacterium]